MTHAIRTTKVTGTTAFQEATRCVIPAGSSGSWSKTSDQVSNRNWYRESPWKRRLEMALSDTKEKAWILKRGGQWGTFFHWGVVVLNDNKQVRQSPLDLLKGVHPPSKVEWSIKSNAWWNPVESRLPGELMSGNRDWAQQKSENRENLKNRRNRNLNVGTLKLVISRTGRRMNRRLCGQ
jgi:hypothetical protein